MAITDMEHRELAVINCGPNQELRVQRFRDGHYKDLLSLRMFVRDNGVMMPQKGRGFLLRTDHLEELIKALMQAAQLIMED